MSWYDLPRPETVALAQKPWASQMVYASVCSSFCRCIILHKLLMMLGPSSGLVWPMLDCKELGIGLNDV